MKKLKLTLKRKICNILSAYALFCDGKGYFKLSSSFGFPINEDMRIDISKESGFSYQFEIRQGWRKRKIISASITYNIFSKDIPIQRSYTITKFNIVDELNNIKELKMILEKMKVGT